MRKFDRLQIGSAAFMRGALWGLAAFVLLPGMALGHDTSLAGVPYSGSTTIQPNSSVEWHIEQDVPGTTEYTLLAVTGSDPGAVTVVEDTHHGHGHSNDVAYTITGVSPGTATVQAFWQHYDPDGTPNESATFSVNITVASPPVFTSISPGTGANFLVGDASVNNSLNFTASADFISSSQFPTFFSFNGSNCTSFTHGNGERVYDCNGSAPVGTGTGPKDITILVQTNLGFSDQRTFSVNVAENTPPSNIEVDSPANGSTVVVANANTSNTVSVSGSFVDPDQNLTGVTVNGINATFAAVGNTGGFGFSQDVIVSGEGSQFITVQVNDDFGAASVQRSFNLEQNLAPGSFTHSASDGSTFLVADASISNFLAFNGTLTDANTNLTGVEVNSTPCSFGVADSFSGTYNYDCSAPLSAGAGLKSVVLQGQDELGSTGSTSFTVTMTQNTAPSNLSFTPANNSDLPSNDIGKALSILVSGSFEDPDKNMSSVTVNGLNTLFTTTSGTNLHTFSTNIDLAAGTGSRDISVVLTDDLGGTTSQTNTVNVVESFGPADITFTPLDLWVVGDPTQSNTVDVSGTVTDRDLNLSSVTVNNVSVFFSRVDGSTDFNFSGSVTVPANTTSFPITVQAEDANSETASATNTVLIEQNTAPTSVTHDLEDGARVLVADATQSNTVDLSGTIFDANGNLSGVTVNGTAAIFNADASAPLTNVGGVLRQQLFRYQMESYPLPAGSGNQSINVVAIDDLGLQGSTSFSVNVVQNSAPSGLSFTPAANADIVVADATQANNVQVSGTVNDVDGNLSGVTVNNTVFLFTADNTNSSTGLTEGWSFTGAAPVAAGSGSRTIDVVLTDGLGATLQEQRTVNIVQNSTPSAFSFTPADGSSFFFADVTQDQTMSVTGTLVDPDLNINSVTVNGIALAFQVDNTASGTYSYNGNITVPGGNAAGFQSAFQFQAQDALGASASQTHTVNILPIPPPTVSSVSPNSIDHTSSTGATVQGSDFQSGATVTVGGVSVSGSFLNETTLSISIPSGAPGPVDVVVTNPDGQSGTLANGFTYTVTQTQPTSTGSNVPVSLPVPSGNVAEPTVTFSDVSSSGTTTLTTSSAPPSGASTPPSGFQIGDDPVYYDLSTTASFTGPVELCFDYSNTSLAGISNEDRLRLFHFVSSSWTDITTSVDTGTQTICGSTSSFSPFAIFTPTLAVPVPVPFSGASTTDFTPTLDWNDAAGAVTYNLEWADNGAFASSTVITNLATSEYTFTVSLADGTYFWRVQSVDASNNTSAYSTADSFVIIPTFAEWTAIFVAAAMLLYLAFHRLGLRR